jgi:hypothetical protein
MKIQRCPVDRQSSTGVVAAHGAAPQGVHGMPAVGHKADLARLIRGK